MFFSNKIKTNGNLINKIIVMIECDYIWKALAKREYLIIFMCFVNIFVVS